MPSPPAQRPAPRTGQVIMPDRLATAKQAAEAERERIRAEAHEEGKHHGLRLAGRYRDVALIAISFVVGMVAGMGWSMSLQDRGAYTAAAITDRVLGRTVPDPGSTLPPPLTNVHPADEYAANAEAAREGCTAEQLRAGRRNCRARNAPPDAGGRP